MKRIHLAPWFLLLAVAGFAGCERMKTPDPFPQATANAWLGAFNSGDLVGLGLYYAEDAQLLPPDQPIVAGHEAIDAFWKTFNPGEVRIEVSAVESERLGDYWYRQGLYAAKYANEGEPRIGKFIELWKKVDSNWMLYRHMWSPNAPLPAEMPELAPDEPA